ncbi:hypothetical protein [Spiroplasma citri]|uniref:hypothetical protein n=1 Tax=Spiroplasma citri TaxID=2133 RepID=UPI00148B1FD4|nr:hypothetical protein [Spiroplasma citri]QJU61894.1 hypothetical protein HHA36_05715 [Spiroplasma citri]
MIKIGIDPSATGVTGIVVFENNKLIRKEEYYRKDWNVMLIVLLKLFENIKMKL